MIFVTGDIHGKYGLEKLDSINFPESKELTKDDYLIIAGDFGSFYNDKLEEQFLLESLNQKNFTTLFVDGNHENFELLDSLPVSNWNGGNVHILSDSVMHLMRGQIYTIDDVKIFTFGGAHSFIPMPDFAWSPREMPSDEEYAQGLANLKKHEWTVEYVVSHECSGKAFDELSKYMKLKKYTNELRDYLDIIEDKAAFEHWFFGHYHADGTIDDFHTVLYDKIIRIL